MDGEKIKSFLNNNWVVTILGSLLLFGVGYVYNYFNAFSKINDVWIKVDSLVVKMENLNTSLSGLKNNYFVKDVDGIEVYVGVSSELKQHMVSIYNDNKLNLSYSDPIQLANCFDVYQPAIKLIVGKVLEKGNDQSDADIFISKEAAIKLGFNDYQKVGIMKFKFKKIMIEEKKNNKLNSNTQ